VKDQGDFAHATVKVLIFRHESPSTRLSFRFSAFTSFCTNIRNHYQHKSLSAMLWFRHGKKVGTAISAAPLVEAD